MKWPTVLHGDGWSATWSAPRPVIGQVRLRGRLTDDLEIGVRTGVRGLVRHVQVVTETIDKTDPDQRNWRPIPSEQRLRDVQVGPRRFDDGLVLPPHATTTGWYSPVPGDPYIQEVGVLVDLDLDHVPPLPLRPSIVPGSLAAAGSDVWVADVRLPTVVRIRGALTDGPEVIEYSWPGRILDSEAGRGRALHPDPEGCWITGSDGIHRADNGGAVQQVRDESTWLTAAHRGVLAVQVHFELGHVRTPMALRLVDPAGTVAEVELTERSVQAMVPCGEDGFMLLLRHVDHPPDPDAGSPGGQVDGRPWLATLSPRGELTEGPYLQLGHPGLVGLIAADPPLLVDENGGGLRRVDQDLSVGDSLPQWRRALRGYADGNRMWTVAHPPHPADIARHGAEACWPLSSQPEYPETRQY